MNAGASFIIIFFSSEWGTVPDTDAAPRDTPSDDEYP
jgi:hypothetical protein